MPSIAYNAENYMEAAFAPAALAHKCAVLADTFGHLAPKRNKDYSGYVVFSIAAYGGDMVILDADFTGLPDSPWLYEAMYEFVFDDRELIHGAIYRWGGTFRNYRFKGIRTVLYCPVAATSAEVA